MIGWLGQKVVMMVVDDKGRVEGQECVFVCVGVCVFVKYHFS